MAIFGEGAWSIKCTGPAGVDWYNFRNKADRDFKYREIKRKKSDWNYTKVEKEINVNP